MKRNTTRQALLNALTKAGGTPLSGQELAQQLGVTRAAVWKAVRALQAEGYRTSAHSGLGYTLDTADLLTPEAVLSAAPRLTAPVLVYESLPGTNDTLRALAAEGAPHGTLVLAAGQSAGRGRLGRSFVSPAGKGLYMSLLLRPGTLCPDALTVTAAAAVAVCRAVEQLGGPSLGIKWVNDLYLNGRKVCGILTEGTASLETGTFDSIVVGIGLNLTAEDADFGPELSRRAGSLYPGGSAPFSRAALAGAIARELLDLSPDFAVGEEYRSRSFLPGHWVTVSGDGPDYPAQVLGIDDRCRLLIAVNGRKKALQHGEVSIRPAPV